jgi:hypothetical protein
MINICVIIDFLNTLYSLIDLRLILKKCVDERKGKCLTVVCEDYCWIIVHSQGMFSAVKNFEHSRCVFNSSEHFKTVHRVSCRPLLVITLC